MLKPVLAAYFMAIMIHLKLIPVKQALRKIKIEIIACKLTYDTSPENSSVTRTSLIYVSDYKMHLDVF